MVFPPKDIMELALENSAPPNTLAKLFSNFMIAFSPKYTDS